MTTIPDQDFDVKTYKERNRVLDARHNLELLQSRSTRVAEPKPKLYFVICEECDFSVSIIGGSAAEAAAVEHAELNRTHEPWIYARVPVRQVRHRPPVSQFENDDIRR